MHEHKVSQKDLGTQSFSLIPSRSKLKKLLELSSHYLLKLTSLGLSFFHFRQERLACD